VTLAFFAALVTTLEALLLPLLPTSSLATLATRFFARSDALPAFWTQAIKPRLFCYATALLSVILSFLQAALIVGKLGYIPWEASLLRVLDG